MQTPRSLQTSAVLKMRQAALA